MFWSGFLYFAVGMYCIFVNDFVPVWLAQVTWISMLCLPFAIPPFGRWLNMDINWDKNMFDFFKKKDDSNVVPFPEQKNQYKAPPGYGAYVEPPPKEEPAKIFYRIGSTDQRRVAFSMGGMEITMNKLGCQHMIDQLTVFMNQLDDDDDEEEQ